MTSAYNVQAMRRILLLVMTVIGIVAVLLLVRTFLLGRQSAPRDQEPSAESVHIIFCAGGAPSEIELWQSLLDDFARENPGISVELRQLPADSDQQHAYYTTLLGSGQPDVDVMRLDVIWVPEFVDAGWLAPLDASALETNDFLSFASRVDSYRGVWFAVPWNVDAGVLYYRKDLLHEAGIDRVPETWRELTDAVRRIRRLENAPREGFVWQGRQYEGLACVYLEQVMSRGGSLDPRDEFARGAHLEALTYLRALIERKLSPANTASAMDEERAREMFQNGDAVFMRNWPYAWSLLNAEYSPVAGKVGIAALPRGKGGASTGALGGWHLAIPVTSAHKEAAQGLIVFLASAKVQEELAARLNWLPTRLSVWNSPQLAQMAPQVMALKEVAPTATPRPAIPSYPALSLAVQEIVSGVLVGRLSPDEACDRLEAKLKEFR